jgi:hypothetical protein
LMTLAGVIRLMAPASVSVNQRLPSGPAIRSRGAHSTVERGSGSYGVLQAHGMPDSGARESPRATR